MINYTEKGWGLHAAIRDAGHRLSRKDGVFVSDDDVAVQAIIDNYDELAEAKKHARARVKQVAAEKVSEIYTFIDPESTDIVSFYNYTIDIYQTIKPASRQTISGDLLLFKNIRDAAAAAITGINAMTDWTLVSQYDAVSTPSWP